MDEMKTEDDTVVNATTGDEDRNHEPLQMGEDKTSEVVKIDTEENSDAVKMDADKNSDAVKVDGDKTAGNGDGVDASVPVGVSVTEPAGSPTAQSDSSAAQSDSSAAKSDSLAAKSDSLAAKSDSPAAKSDSPAAKSDSPAERRKKAGKVDILFKATGNAPIMKKSKWSVEENKSIATMVDFIRRYLKTDTQQSIFIYVNQSFAPSPDVALGVLFECFGADGKLVLHYCMTQAWG